MCTIKDVAQLAGVATGTVSNYFNGKSIRDSNRIKIEKAIEELGYKPITKNDVLDRLEGGCVGVLASKISNKYTSIVLNEITKHCSEMGLTLKVDVFNNDEELYRIKLEKILNSNILGLMVIDGFCVSNVNDIFENVSVPVVAVNSQYECSNVCNIMSNNRRSSRIVVDSIIKKGFNEIGVICGPIDNYSSSERLSGIEESFHRSDLPLENVKTIFTDDWSSASGFKAMEQLLDDDMGCIFVCGARLSLGATAAANVQGKIPGRDFEYCYYTYENSCMLSNPGVTSILYGASEVGRYASINLLSGIKSKALLRDGTLMLRNNIHSF